MIAAITTPDRHHPDQRASQLRRVAAPLLPSDHNLKLCCTTTTRLSPLAQLNPRLSPTPQIRAVI
jgi:hypothetical protein